MYTKRYGEGSRGRAIISLDGIECRILSDLSIILVIHCVHTVNHNNNSFNIIIYYNHKSID